MVEDALNDEFETVVVVKPSASKGPPNNKKKGGATSSRPSSQQRAPPADQSRQRLLVASSRARNVAIFLQSVVKDVIVTVYKYESSTFDTILAQVASAVDGKKVESVAFVVHGIESELYLCGPGEKVLNTTTANDDVSVREFFKSLCEKYVEKSRLNARLDFLAAHTAHTHDGPMIAATLQSLLEIPVSMSADLQGTDVEVICWKGQGSSKVPLGDLYFDHKKLKENVKMAGPAAKTRTKDMTNYEMIRTVGKGAFGTAILYRRKEDDTLVIIKEINMLELSAVERQMSLNEVNVLALLDHPHIVRYMDSFEMDTKLCIEMEYCDGGSMAQFLTQQASRLEERDILVIFHQICSAIRNMHENQILHRDLKTANLFMTKEGLVKVGDFGISKMLSTRQANANTVLGTPYYISPEMCEGKEYNEKSDIWALGCILYEMACLQKTFEGSNLPALVNKIMKGQFAPIKGNYSPGFRQLVRDLLQRDPAFRPTAAEIVSERIPELLAQFSVDSVGEDEIDDELKQSLETARLNHASRSSRPLRSVVYHMKVYSSSVSLTPVPLPPRTRVKELSVSNTHVIVLTAEYLVYTWGEGRRGQLGHGSPEGWRGQPTVVEALRGKNMTRVVAGDGFSVFASDNGIIMTCGDGTTGCLGHGDWNSTAKPKLVEKLLSVDVGGLSCGPHHVVVVGAEGEVYSWGKGDGGRLGQGHEEDCCIPTEVELQDEVIITNVKCGGDGTILISDQGAMLACGNNADNKLALSETGGLFSVRTKREVTKVLVPTRVRSIECRVVDVSMGPFHTAILKETGQVVTFGRNNEGQLGRGSCKPTTQPVVVREMQDRVVTMVQCGSTFTVVGTLENAIYLWGTRAVLPASRPTTQDGFSMSIGRRSTPGSASKDPDFNFADASRSTGPGTPGGTSVINGRRSSEDTTQSRDIKMRDVLLQPQEILALYASPSQVAKGETVNLASLNCQNQSVFVVVDTTAPLPRKLRRTASLGGSASKAETLPPFKPVVAQAKTEQALSMKQEARGKEDLETMGAVPAWLKAELNDTEIVWSGSKPDKKDVNRRPMTTPAQLPSHVNVRETAQEADEEAWRPPPIRRQARQPFSKEDPDGRTDSPFTPSSPPNEPGRWTKASGRRGSHSSQQVPVKKQGDSTAEQIRLRKLNRELILKENKLKNQSTDIAKEKEAALNDEIERLRSELLKHQDFQNKALRNNMADQGKKPVTDSTTCAVM